jgi:hypothetical protein
MTNKPRSISLYHGSGLPLSSGTLLRPERDLYNYLATTDSWADAFAYRDAASRAIDAAVQRAMTSRSGPDPSILHSGVSRVRGYIHAVELDGSTEPDPDFRACVESLRTLSTVTVVSSKQGLVQSWRKFTSIVGPYQTWIESQSAFDADGYLQPPPLWESWGYTRQDLRALGPWYPMLAVWEDATTRQLLLVNEFSLPFWGLPASRGRRFSTSCARASLSQPRVHQSPALPGGSKARQTMMIADVARRDRPALGAVEH